MVTNHPTLNNARLATFKRTKIMLGLNNRTILNTTKLKNSGIPICEGPIS
jgi:hypothetical protein